MTDQTPPAEDEIDLGDRHFQSVETLGRIGAVAGVVGI
jgi:hypothetical protein